MKKILFSLLAVAAALVGCTRELEPEGSTLTPSSKYLVISADCSPETKTDINEGKSTWEAGDIISVLYNGQVYEYVAGTPSEDGKQTYFTSSAGISDYDGSELVAYYEPVNAEDGTVGVAAEREIAFQAEGQVNSACAPLVGIPTPEALTGGVLNMYFKNIFSVVELRIDPAGSQMTSAPKTLKIEPAEGSTFSGYISCSATVDPSTLALETSSTGNSLTLKFPTGADLKLAQTLKFPVGRFTSSKGLKATLTLEDGSVLVKDIYKSGISTYREEDGYFSVMHLARAMYAFSGGIACAQDLIDFSAAVNSGGSLIEYMNDEGKVVLLDDIDMTGVTDWTPIGNAKMTNYEPTDGNAFTGHFDGQGHSILNFKMTPDLASGEAQDGRTYGLFGFLQNAVVENLTMGAEEGDNGELTFSANGTTDVGVVAGVTRSSTISNCVNYIPMTVNGNATDDKRTTMAAFSGYVISMAGETTILENLTNYGGIVAKPGSCTKNGATSVQAAGVAGFAHANVSAVGNKIVDCVNYGEMTSSVPRTSGILAAANLVTTVERCINYGTQTNTNTDCRLGQITCIVSDNCIIKDCENYGDVIAKGGTGGHVGGLVCLLTKTKNATEGTCEVIGGGNYANVISDRTSSNRGLLIANMSVFAKVDGLVAGGGIGTYNNGSPVMVELTTDNYMDYIGTISSNNESKVTNIIFNGADAKGIRTADELMEFASLVNAGSSTAKFEQNGMVVLLNDIDMSGKTWTPIGNAVTPVGATNEAAITGNTFTGHFNGNGFSIRNLQMESNSATVGQNYGFFGVLGSGAVVENLVFDSSCSLNVTATASLASGVVAGYVYDATVKNVISYAPMTFNGKAGDAKFMSMAMIGQSYADTKGSLIDNCHNYGEIKAYNSDNTANNATAYHAAGVVGYTMSPTSAKVVSTISNCTNHAQMTSGLARTSGIVAAATRGAALKNCTNYGDQFNNFYKSSNARLGGIVCLAAEINVTIEDCINYGDITSSTKAAVGGIVCVHKSGAPTGCENYGIMLTDHSSRGLLQAYDMKNFSTAWSGGVAGGLVGTYNGGVPYYDVYWGDLTAYYGVNTYGSTFTDVTFALDVLDPEAQEEDAAIDILFIGNSFTQDAVTHLPGILAAAGIKNVNMTHMYYGGCLMTTYNNEWDSKSNFVRFDCKPGGRTWVPTKGQKLSTVAGSQDWDIVTIQEHTGNSDAWTWNDEAKTNISGVISKIKACQSTDPKIYYIMSQAYHDMTLADGDPTWTQLEMFETIVAFAQNVVAECDIDGLIPTGTVLQNLRTSSYNNDLTLSRDGYHMDYGLARYGASCAVFETIFTPKYQVKMDGNTYRYARTGTGHTPVTDVSAAVALQAARSAMNRPFVVSNMAENPGIDSADDMYNFLTAVSEGTSTFEWENADGEVNLLSNISLSSITAAQWQALADATSAVNKNTSCVLSDNSFTGVFDGNDFTISGFNPTVALAANNTFGLFCQINGATIKDLNLSGTMNVSATEQSDAGLLIGTALNSTVKNVTVSGKIVSSGTTASKRFALGGVCGFVAADGGSTLFEDCTSEVVAEGTYGSNAANGLDGTQYGGIAGVSTVNTAQVSTVTFRSCTNNGNMNIAAGRCSGLVATSLYHTTLTGCVNNGDQKNAIGNGRLGNITSYLGKGCKLYNCVNNGDIEATDPSYAGTLAGMVGLAADDSESIIEGGGNYGTVKAQACASNKYKGLLVANFMGASIKNVVASGKIIFAGAQLDINASNYMDYICGSIASEATASGITYVAPAE